MKLTLTSKTLRLALAGVFILGFGALAANAQTAIAPGGTLASVPTISPSLPAANLLQTLTVPYSDGITSGTFTSQIYSNGSTLDFTYQFDIAGAFNPARFVLGVDLVGFGNFTTSVGSIDAFGGPLDVHPSGASRAADGNRLSFFFTAPAVDTTNPFSEILFVRTNAPLSFRATTLSQVVSGSTGNINVRSLTPVPEPATALFGLALCGAIGASRRRAAKATSAA